MDDHRQLQPLERIEVSEARRTLGVRSAGDGNMKAQFEFMKSEAKKWADAMRTNKLPRHMAWEALHTTVLRSLAYPLVATTLSEEQCRDIISPVLMQSLPKCGMNRHYPHKVAYAPISFQGIGLPSVFTTQGLDHMKALVRFSGYDEQLTSDLLRTSAEQLKLELGLNGPVFQRDWETWNKIATNCWVKHTWSFCIKNKLLVTDDIPDFKPRRTNDKLLMRAFAQFYSGDSLKKLNQCRLYLQVVWASEIFSADNKILPTAWDGI